MADTAHAAPDGAPRRDFLKLVTGAFAAVGVGAIAWPFIASLMPAKDTLALASTDVDLAPIAEGQAVTVMWRGKPVFVRHRTAEEIAAARAVPLSELKDPARDEQRVQRQQ
ncbi:MAG: ubiquinol-cytochrome c reductase iron-sulfur subunit, partial [Alphaproteobacteria bacterium]